MKVAPETAATIAVNCVRKLMDQDNLTNTFGVVVTLRAALNNITTTPPDGDLAKELLRLYSLSIIGALHKHEIGITNGVIKEKNRILDASGIDYDRRAHAVINPDDHPYNW